MASRHSWEEEPRSWELPDAGAVNDEALPGTLDWEGESDDESKVFCNGEEAGTAFMDVCMEMLNSGRMSAKTVCTLCWYASRAGALGPVARYALNPESPSGHFQRHIDRKNGFAASEKLQSMLHISVGINSKYEAARAMSRLPVQAPHECMRQEVLANTQLVEQLEKTLADAEWAPAYYNHTVVRS